MDSKNFKFLTFLNTTYMKNNFLAYVRLIFAWILLIITLIILYPILKILTIVFIPVHILITVTKEAWKDADKVVDFFDDWVSTNAEPVKKVKKPEPCKDEEVKGERKGG